MKKPTERHLRVKKLDCCYGPTAIVLGASAGIGLAFAEELARQGLNLFLVARKSEALKTVAEKLRTHFDVEVSILSLDLSREEPWKEIRRAIGRDDWGLVVYNAAASPIGPFLDMNPEAVMRTVSVNIASPLNVVHTAGNELRNRYRESGRRGGIILLSSLSGFRGSPNISAYAASKAWNTVLAEGAGEEMRREGVDLMACVAGATATPGFHDSLRNKGPGAPVQTPRAVARAALRGLGQTSMLIPGFLNRLTSTLIYGLLPRRWSTAILGRATGKLRRRDDAGL